MKQVILFIFFTLFLTTPLFAQEKKEPTVNDVVNTLKERITLQGYMQTGYTYDEASESNTFDFKRAILMVRGKITDRWSCYFMCNIAASAKMLEAYTEYTFMPELTVRMGQFKTMFSAENPLSTTVVELIDVYSQAVGYLAGGNSSDPLYGAHGGRDMGLLIYGDLFNKFASYNLAVMNGQGINVKDRNNHKDIVGGLMLHPAKWLSVGGSFILGKGCAIATSTATPDIAVGENYTRNRYALSAVLKTKALDLRTEYLAGKDGNVKSDGYYATFSAHVLPKFDVVASYDYLNKNKTMDDKQTNYVVGVQYWFYPRCRVQAQYTRREPKNGEGSNLIQAQVQVRF